MPSCFHSFLHRSEQVFRKSYGKSVLFLCTSCFLFSKQVAPLQNGPQSYLVTSSTRESETEATIASRLALRHIARVSLSATSCTTFWTVERIWRGKNNIAILSEFFSKLIVDSYVTEGTTYPRVGLSRLFFEWRGSSLHRRRMLLSEHQLLCFILENFKFRKATMTWPRKRSSSTLFQWIKVAFNSKQKLVTSLIFLQHSASYCWMECMPSDLDFINRFQTEPSISQYKMVELMLENFQLKDAILKWSKNLQFFIYSFLLISKRRKFLR